MLYAEIEKYDFSVRSETNLYLLFYTSPYRHTSTLFGLENAPPSLQRVLRIILFGFQSKTRLVSRGCNDIFSKKLSTIKDIDEVLTILLQAELPLKLHKSHFPEIEIEYFWHIRIPGRLSAASRIVDGTKTADFPTDRSQIRSILVTEIVSKTFIDIFSRVLLRLNDHLRKEKEKDWSNHTIETVTSFDMLVSIFLKSFLLILQLPHRTLMI